MTTALTPAWNWKTALFPATSVTIVYVGAVTDGDASKAKVRKIISTDDNSGVLNLAEKAEENLTGISGSAITSEDEGQDEPASGVSVEQTSGTGTIVSSVNVRADAQSGSEILGTVRRRSFCKSYGYLREWLVSDYL